MGAGHFRKGVQYGGRPGVHDGTKPHNPVFMANSTLGRKVRRTRVPMSIDLHPGPHATTIRAILSYSKALKVVDAPPVGEIALVLN